MKNKNGADYELKNKYNNCLEFYIKNNNIFYIFFFKRILNSIFIIIILTQ